MQTHISLKKKKKKNHIRFSQAHIIRQNTALSLKIFIQQPLKPFHLEGHQGASGNTFRLFLRGHKAPPCSGDDIIIIVIIPSADLGRGQDGDGDAPGGEVLGETMLVCGVEG